MMKAFMYFEDFTPTYPEEFDIIKDYLMERGKVNISDKQLEYQFFDFSEECYSASWMCVTSSDRERNSEILERFANWLSEIDVYNGRCVDRY